MVEHKTIWNKQICRKTTIERKETYGQADIPSKEMIIMSAHDEE